MALYEHSSHAHHAFHTCVLCKHLLEQTMKTSMQRFALDLAPGVVFPIAQAQGVTIRIKRGLVWITEEGHLDDVLLRGGAHYEILTEGKVVVEAFSTTRIEIEAPEAISIMSLPGVAALGRALSSLWRRLKTSGGAVQFPKAAA
jgi:hypothetical protein